MNQHTRYKEMDLAGFLNLCSPEKHGMNWNSGVAESTVVYEKLAVPLSGLLQ